MKRSVGDLLLWAGAAVGAGGGVLLAMGAWVHLPAALVIAIAKALPFVVAAALLTIGAVVRRSALRAAATDPTAVRGPADGARAIGVGAPPAAGIGTPRPPVGDAIARTTPER